MAIHEECYGLDSTGIKNPNFQCHACQAVGTKIKGQFQNGSKMTILQEKRPTECVLCAVSDGTHAMHALYRSHGPNGRQLILPAGRHAPERLAWVHSLCALTVCNHRGTRGGVYGADVDGNYEGDDGTMHHFVMCGLSNDPEDRAWIQNLVEHRSLQCYICGHHDKSAGRNLRVPLQCCAGDDEEYEEFKQFHLQIGEPCTQAMHVGCAMWLGAKGRTRVPRAVWFYPGVLEREDGEYLEPATEIFCNLHARQTDASATGIRKDATVKDPGRGLLTKAPDDAKKSRPVLPTYTSPSIERRASYPTDGSKSTASLKRKEGPVEQRASHLTSGSKDTAASLKRKERPVEHTLAAKKTKVVSVTEETPVRRSSDVVAKHAAKPATSKALLQGSSKSSSATDSTPTIPRKSRDAGKTLTPVSSIPRQSRDAGKTTTTIAAIPRRSPTFALQGKRIVPSHAQHKKDSPMARTLLMSAATEPASTNTANSTTHSFTTPSPVKRRRTRNISEEKMGDKGDDKMSSINDGDLDDVRVNIDSANQEDDTNGMWMDDTVQGLVKTTELPPIDAPPEGENPWAYLWEAGAPRFKIEIVESAERKST